MNGSCLISAVFSFKKSRVKGFLIIREMITVSREYGGNYKLVFSSFLYHNGCVVLNAHTKRARIHCVGVSLATLFSLPFFSFRAGVSEALYHFGFACCCCGTLVYRC